MMLVIRDAQIEILEGNVLSGWLKKHLVRFFPGRCGELGPEGLARAIADGIARARAYGFQENGDISRYLDIAFVLGLGFDRDEALPWTRRFLDAGSDSPTERMDALVAAVESHRRMDAGKGKKD